MPLWHRSFRSSGANLSAIDVGSVRTFSILASPMNVEGSIEVDAARSEPAIDSQKRQSVGIFWDFENVGLPASNAKASTIVRTLCTFAQTYGTVKALRAYMDRTLRNSSEGVTFGAALRELGIDLIDCPHAGRREVVDKGIITDLYEFALDNPPPATIILISGDSGYLGAVSKLSLRGYKMIVVTPATTKQTYMMSQTTEVWTWRDGITENVWKPTPGESLPGKVAAHDKLKAADEVINAPKIGESKAAISLTDKKRKAKMEPEINVPSHFRPLVQILKEQMQKGFPGVERSELQSIIAQHFPMIYAEAGVPGLKKYIAKARKAGVVLFTKKDGVVSLTPCLR